MSIILLITACQRNTEQNVDLLAHGLPIEIAVPDSVEIAEKDWGIQKDLTLKNEQGFNLQIFATDAEERNLNNRSLAEKKLVQTSQYFDKFIVEEPHGFVFQLNIDSSLSYDFRHFKLMGDKELLFRTGMFGTFTEGQVMDMYERSKAAH